MFGVSNDYVTKLCKDSGFGELKGSNTLSLEKPDDNYIILDESGQRRHRQLLRKLLWLDRPGIKNAVCQLSTYVGTATTRDEINIKRLLGYLIGNPACNMIVGCNLDVPGIAGIPQGSVVVMTDADLAGDVKDRRSYSGIAVWVKGWQIVQMLTWNDCALHGQPSSSGICETQGCESTHSSRHEGLLYAGLGDGTWTTYLEGTW